MSYHASAPSCFEENADTEEKKPGQYSVSSASSSKANRALDLSGSHIGIVGAGMAGLYTALLLQRQGCTVQIFESTDRVGGRVFTHHFKSPEENQYFEAGAMRVPRIPSQTLFFDLVDHINAKVAAGFLAAPDRIDLIKFILRHCGNDVFMNGQRPEVDGRASLSTPALIKWHLSEQNDQYKHRTAGSLLQEAIGGFCRTLQESDDFETDFKKLIDRWDNFSLRYYCTSELKWPSEIVDFMETTLFHPNQLAHSVPHIVKLETDFSTDEDQWVTIAGGMSRLPEAMARLVGLENIMFGSRVVSIADLQASVQAEAQSSKKVIIETVSDDGTTRTAFDQIVIAMPPMSLKAIPRRPRWGSEKEMALRTINLGDQYKMGLRFKVRFWESMVKREKTDQRVLSSRSLGGQTSTDLPTRWVIFPSYGISDSGPGVLLIYTWLADVSYWSPLTKESRRTLALECLSSIFAPYEYNDKSLTVATLRSLLVETADIEWSESSVPAAAMFLPGQLSQSFEAARKPEGNIYFAGEHLSYQHCWISGALDSALRATRDLLRQKLKPLTAKG